MNNKKHTAAKHQLELKASLSFFVKHVSGKKEVLVLAHETIEVRACVCLLRSLLDFLFFDFQRHVFSYSYTIARFFVKPLHGRVVFLA